MNCKNFIKELSNYESANVFNPYSDICKVFDKKNANHIRLKNLELILSSLSNKEVDAIWIGRDLGHRGGRRTGLALTDEGNLEAASKMWDVELKQATVGDKVRERTAANIWNYISLIDSNIFTWNVFPFHPHELKKPFTNRAHTAKERDVGLEMLWSIVDLLRPKKIVAIGNDAYKCSLRISDQYPIYKIRHPSYGGEKDFSTQLCKLYDLDKTQTFSS